MRGRRGAWLGTALAAGLLAWLVLRMEDRGALAEALAAAFRRPAPLALGVAFFGMGLACGALRWWALLRALALPIRGGRALQLYAVGHFFNGLVPGTTGGDVLKAACAAADCPGRRPEAVASIVAERVIGLAALCLLAAGVAALFPSFYGRAPELQVLRGFALLLGFGAVAGLGLLFGVDWLRRAEDDAGPDAGWWRRVAGVAVRLYRAMRLCAARPRVLGAAFLLSLVNHLCHVACAAALGSALGLRLTPADYLAAMPLVNALSAVPLTPGGAGIRETAAVAVLSLAGVPAAGATALSLLLYGVMLAWAAAGGVCYVALRWRASHPATGR
jgi:uncharacterized membrane protein YbhN (UPF0104 family)